MTALPRYLKPRDYAEILGVSDDKVHAWIVAGHLRAVDCSAHLGVGRPRWRIHPDAVAEFEAKRSTTPPVKMRRKWKSSPQVASFIK